MENILYAVFAGVTVFLFVGSYKIGYYRGRLDGLKSERELLDEWEESDAKLFAAWEKDIKDMREHSNKIIAAWEDSNGRLFAAWGRDIEEFTGEMDLPLDKDE